MDQFVTRSTGGGSVAFAVTNCFDADTLTPISAIPRAIGWQSRSMRLPCCSCRITEKGSKTEGDLRFSSVCRGALEHGDFSVADIVHGCTNGQLLLLHQIG
jgi:hypothetical protein